MSKPTLEMLSPQNWAALFTGTTGAHLKLASSSTYTVTDAQGVEIEIKGDNLRTSNFFGVHVLSGGTITGFELFKKGKRIALGSHYDLPGSSFYNAMFRYLMSGAKTALLDLFVNAGESISGSWKTIEGGLSSLWLHKSIAEINLTSGKASVSTATFAADKATLDKIVGGFQVHGAAAEVKSELSALEGDVKHVDSIHVANSRTDKLKVSTAVFSSARAALDKIVGGFQVAGGASALEAKLKSLSHDAKHISAIDVTNGRLSVGVSAFGKDRAILDKVTGGFAIDGSAAAIQADLKALNADIRRIDSIRVSGAKIDVTAAVFARDHAILDKIVGGFALTASVKAIEGDFTALKAQADHAHLAALRITQKGTPTFHLSVGEAKGDGRLLKAIHGGYVVDVHSKSGTVSAGHGNRLTIHDVAGHDKIWANGADERFVFDSRFGEASVGGVDRRLAGKSHDTFVVEKPSSRISRPCLTTRTNPATRSSSTASTATD